MKNNRYLYRIIGLILGAIGGYTYYRMVGCSNGTCLITSSPIISSLYGGFMGLMLGQIFEKSPSQKTNKNLHHNEQQ